MRYGEPARCCREIIGHGRAAELLYTGRNLTGEEAERWGFLNRLCAPEMLLTESEKLAAELGGRSNLRCMP